MAVEGFITLSIFGGNPSDSLTMFHALEGRAKAEFFEYYTFTNVVDAV